MGPAAGDADPTWLFARVPEPKTVKNRLHLDVIATDPEAEIARLVVLGTARIADREEARCRSDERSLHLTSAARSEVRPLAEHGLERVGPFGGDDGPLICVYGTLLVPNGK